MAAGDLSHLLLGGGGGGAHELDSADFQEMLAVMLLKQHRRSIGSLAGGDGGGDFHFQPGAGGIQSTLLCPKGEFRDFLAELGEGEAGGGGGFRQERGFGHAGYGVGLEDVGAVPGIKHNIDAGIDFELKGAVGGECGGLNCGGGFFVKIGGADVLGADGFSREPWILRGHVIDAFGGDDVDNGIGFAINDRDGELRTGNEFLDQEVFGVL